MTGDNVRPEILDLRQELNNAGITTKLVGDFGGRVVCASRHESGALRGNSFWLAYDDQRLIIATWVPHYYVVPREVDAVELVRTVLTMGERAIYTIDEPTMQAFGLIEVALEDTGLA